MTTPRTNAARAYKRALAEYNAKNLVTEMPRELFGVCSYTALKTADRSVILIGEHHDVATTRFNIRDFIEFYERNIQEEVDFFGEFRRGTHRIANLAIFNAEDYFSERERYAVRLLHHHPIDSRCAHFPPMCLAQLRPSYVDARRVRDEVLSLWTSAKELVELRQNIDKRMAKRIFLIFEDADVGSAPSEKVWNAWPLERQQRYYLSYTSVVMDWTFLLLFFQPDALPRAIVYAGEAHIAVYIKFLLQNGFVIAYRSRTPYMHHKGSLENVELPGFDPLGAISVSRELSVDTLIGSGLFYSIPGARLKEAVAQVPDMAGLPIGQLRARLLELKGWGPKLTDRFIDAWVKIPPKERMRIEKPNM